MKQIATITCIIILSTSAVIAQGQQSSDYGETEPEDIFASETAEETIPADVSEQSVSEQGEYEIADILSHQGSLEKFAEIAESTDLSAVVDPDNGITIFAPSDNALNETELPADPQSFIESCIVSGKIGINDLLVVSQLTAVNGSTINVETDGNGQVLVNGMLLAKAENTENDLIALYILEPLEAEVVSTLDTGETAVGTGG